MKTIGLALVLLQIAAAVPAFGTDATGSSVRLTTDQFYSQPPGSDRWWAYNAMSYYQTELVDDIPDHLQGCVIRQVTLYVSEWDCYSWWNPQALVINFYDQTCPPGMSPSIHFEIPWDQLQTEIMQDSGWPFWYVRRVTAQLPSGVTIAPHMCIAGLVVQSWSYDEHGWAGLVVTSAGVVFGCEMYGDDAFQGCPRWTHPTDCSGYPPADLAYSMAGDAPAAVPGPPERHPDLLLASRPNPFTLATTLAYELRDGGPATISIHDPSGRLVRTLLVGTQPPGSHSVVWDGRDDRGQPVLEGAYLARIEVPGERTRSAKIIRIR